MGIGPRTTSGNTWTGKTRITDFTSNPNYQQFGGPYLADRGCLMRTVWETAKGGDAQALMPFRVTYPADCIDCSEMQSDDARK